MTEPVLTPDELATLIAIYEWEYTPYPLSVEGEPIQAISVRGVPYYLLATQLWNRDVWHLSVWLRGLRNWDLIESCGMEDRDILRPGYSWQTPDGVISVAVSSYFDSHMERVTCPGLHLDGEPGVVIPQGEGYSEFHSAYRVTADGYRFAKKATPNKEAPSQLTCVTTTEAIAMLKNAGIIDEKNDDQQSTRVMYRLLEDRKIHHYSRDEWNSRPECEPFTGEGRVRLYEERAINRLIFVMMKEQG